MTSFSARFQMKAQEKEISVVIKLLTFKVNFRLLIITYKEADLKLLERIFE